MADERKQLDLFLDVVPSHARRTDPRTSHAAAAKKAERIQGQRLKIVRSIAAGQRGMILDEIIDATGIQKVSVSPCLRPLARAGYLVNLPEGHAGYERVGNSGTSQMVWYATEKTYALLALLAVAA